MEGRATAAQARAKAEKLRGEVRDRRDPVSERRTAQATAEAAEAEAKRAAAAAAYTVDVLIEDWTNDRLSQRSASYRKRVPVGLRKALADWRAVPAEKLARVDAVRVLDAVKLGSGPIAANRLRAEARACWGWAVRRGTLTVNPWAVTPVPLEREPSRDRVLSDAELGALYLAAGTLGAPWDAMVRLLILTGQRRGEVAGMEWAELDLEAGEWRLPGSRTKNGHPHVVPLVPEMIDILRAVPRFPEAVFVFEGPRKTEHPRATPVSGFGKVKARLDAALVKAMAEAGRRKPAPWVLHDLRRTVATGLQRLGVRLEVTEAMLNHVSGSRSGIVGVYQRHGWEAEKAAAMQAWTAHVLAAAGRQAAPDNVVRLRA